MADSLLSVRDISKRFGGLTAVDRVSFDVEAGQIFGVAGPNGSGKSTLFNIMTKVPFSASGGEVLLEGRAMQGLSPHGISLAGIARTFQRENVFSNLSAIDNILVAVESRSRSLSFGQQVGEAEAMLNQVGFPATMHNNSAGSLPVFYRKQLMIASALALKPRVLLMDEPASSLTGPEIERMKQIILSIRGAGVTIVLIEHVLALLMEVSDRLMVLDQGRMIANGLPDEVIADPVVTTAYLGVQA